MEGNDAGERRLGQRNGKEARHSREKRMAWGWGREWHETGQKCVRSELPEVLMWGAGEMRTRPGVMSRLSTGEGHWGSFACSALPVNGNPGRQEDLWF